MKDKYTEKQLSPKAQAIASAIFIALCIWLMLLWDFEWTIRIFTLIWMWIIAFFTSIWWLIVSVPLWVWLLMLILK